MTLLFLAPYHKIAQKPHTYATLNPADKAPDAVLSNGNMEYSGQGGNGVRSTVGKSADKWYWEATIVQIATGTGAGIGIGVATKQTPLVYPWNSSSLHYTIYFYPGSGAHAYSKGTNFAYGPNLPTAAGDVIGVALDVTGGTLQLFKNGVPLRAPLTIDPGEYFAFLCDDAQNLAEKVSINFGASEFLYPVPEGFNPGLYIPGLFA